MCCAGEAEYYDRLYRVVKYIDGHVDGQLSTELLSEISAFSKYHFQRQFSAVFGIGPQHYISLLRHKRAAHQLAFRETLSVLQIALDCGYEGPEAFSRAFKRLFGQTPSAFRAQPAWAQWHSALAPIDDIRNYNVAQDPAPPAVQIVMRRPVRVAAIEHRGPPTLIGESIRHFIAWRKSTGVVPRVSATFNILYDDPQTTPEADFRLDICAATERTLTDADAGIVSKTIAGGRYALLRHVGSEQSFAAAILALYATWLPSSGEELRDAPLICQRVTFFPDVPENEAITDILLPLAEK
jgi:AraC family transcriptional regulator